LARFSLESRLNELSGGGYQKADQDWGVKVIYDGGVLTGELHCPGSRHTGRKDTDSTGQNPASAKAMGEKLHELVSA
jgi:hypothetical protein